MTLSNKEIEEKIAKSFDSFIQSLTSVRAGRANPHFLEPVRVDAYGQKMTIAQVASVSALDNFTLSVNVWDAGLASSVAKAIRESDLGVNPIAEGNLIRVPLPKLTEQRRLELVKIAKQYGEQAKVAVRNIRRDVIDHLRKQEKDKQISQDDLKKSTDDVQKIVDQYTKKIDYSIEIKEKEIMEV